MRFAFLISGAFGFFLVGGVGLASGRDFEPLLRDAALACLLCAFVGRWFWSGLEQAFAHTLAARRAEAEAAEAAATAPAPAATPPAKTAAPARPVPAAVPVPASASVPRR